MAAEERRTSAEVSSVPEHDTFLPNYISAHLIEVLAKTMPQKTSDSNANLSATASKFIESRKNLRLFTPLTHSIFWNENPINFMDSYTGSLDEVDKYGRSALTLALANENFVLADKLIKKNAIIYLEDKIVLEIALASILQRDPKSAQTILSAFDSDTDKAWAKEYLDYLNAYINQGSTKVRAFRDLLNPTVRHFGQILDTLVYFNGTPSHYGFISPSLAVLTSHLQKYASSTSNSDEQEMFNKIARAYDSTARNCNFHGNLPGNKQCAETIANHIKSNIKLTNKDVTVVFGGWAGNSVALAFINNYVIFTNLGIGGDPDQGSQIYTIANADAITSESIYTFICGLCDAAPAQAILALIGDVLEPNPIFTLKQPLNPIDNCIFVNPRAIIQAIVLVLSALKKDNTLTPTNLGTCEAKAQATYNAYVNDLYQHFTNDLAQFMRNPELVKNRRIECCFLALEYINQHYLEQDALPRCVELKNALEFVGLKEYYNANVSSEARAKIQSFIISTQEKDAILVIEKETKLIANQG